MRPLSEHQRNDADLRADVLRALMLDSVIPTTIDARAKDGTVTLTGSAKWHYQREEAEFVAGNVAGVTSVVDEITLTPPTKHPTDTKATIQKAFHRDARLAAAHLTITVTGGTVTLSGAVQSSPDRTDALSIAWNAPGVIDVKDDLVVQRRERGNA